MELREIATPDRLINDGRDSTLRERGDGRLCETVAGG